MGDLVPDGWIEVDLGSVVVFVNLNYRSNVVVTVNPFDEGSPRKELIPDLEFGTVVVI